MSHIYLSKQTPCISDIIALQCSSSSGSIEQANTVKTLLGTSLFVDRANTIRVPYKGKYISNSGFDFNTRNAVLVALTGSGKTFTYIGSPLTLILVPRVLQTTMNQKETTEELLLEMETNSVIITYEKFLGHMRVPMFNALIQSGDYKIVVDEAHTIVADKIPGYQTIYALNAIFLSGTIDETFRPDLTHYKFIPENRTKIHYTDGIVPDFENGLYFLDKAKALMRHYPDNCIVGAEHKHNNVNPHTHMEGKVFSTSAMREGISISNDIFDASVVVANHCYRWSVKDIIQALNRLRNDDAVRIVTKPIENAKKSNMSTRSAVWLVMDTLLRQDKHVNKIEAQLFNLLIKWGVSEFGVDRALDVCNYGIACFFAHVNRNHYDEELYEFVEYTEPVSKLLINTKTANVSSEDETMLVIDFGDKRYIFEPKYEKRMLAWMKLQVDGGYNDLIPKLVKLDTPTNLKYFFTKGSVAKKFKTMHNKINRKTKYTPEMFIKHISKIVGVKMFDREKKEIKRFTKNTDIKTLNFQVISECPFPCKIE